MLLVSSQVKKYQDSVSFNFSTNIPKRMRKNTPKGDSGKSSSMVEIFIAKFALMKVYVKNQTQGYGMVSILKQESDSFDKKTDRKIIIYT